MNVYGIQQRAENFWDLTPLPIFPGYCISLLFFFQGIFSTCMILMILHSLSQGSLYHLVEPCCMDFPVCRGVCRGEKESHHVKLILERKSWTKNAVLILLMRDYLKMYDLCYRETCLRNFNMNLKSLLQIHIKVSKTHYMQFFIVCTDGMFVQMIVFIWRFLDNSVQWWVSQLFEFTSRSR